MMIILYLLYAIGLAPLYCLTFLLMQSPSMVSITNTMIQKALLDLFVTRLSHTNHLLYSLVFKEDLNCVGTIICL